MIDAYATHLSVLKELFTAFTFDSVFEFGSGKYSTVFFSKNAKAVTSIEMQSDEWFSIVKTYLIDNKISNVDYVLLVDEDGMKSNTLLKESDFVFVDGAAFARVNNIQAAYKKTGVICVHDVQEPGYKWEKLIVEDGWKIFKFVDEPTHTAVLTNRYDVIEYITTKCKIPFVIVSGL